MPRPVTAAGRVDFKALRKREPRDKVTTFWR